MHNRRISKKLRCSRGATLTEYTLHLALLTLVAIPAVEILSNESNESFTIVGDAMSGQEQSFVVAEGGGDGLTSSSEHNDQQTSTSAGKDDDNQDYCDGGGTTSDGCAVTSGTADQHQGGGDDSNDSGDAPANGSDKQ